MSFIFINLSCTAAWSSPHITTKTFDTICSPDSRWRNLTAPSLPSGWRDLGMAMVWNNWYSCPLFKFKTHVTKFDVARLENINFTNVGAALDSKCDILDFESESKNYEEQRYLKTGLPAEWGTVGQSGWVVIEPAFLSLPPTIPQSLSHLEKRAAGLQAERSTPW